MPPDEDDLADIAEAAQSFVANAYRLDILRAYARADISAEEIMEAACGRYSDDPFQPIYRAVIEILEEA